MDRMAGLPVARRPPTTSEWPEMYLVELATTRSAPRRSGCCRYGLANVLSMTRKTPWRLAAAAMRRIGTSDKHGLVGVSAQMSCERERGVSERIRGGQEREQRGRTLVSGRIACSTRSTMAWSWSSSLSTSPPSPLVL